MNLHQALREIVQSFGQEILRKDVLLNILEDYKVFPPQSAIKYILRSFVSSGFMDKILSEEQNMYKAKELIVKFSKSTGFEYKLVSGIYLAIAYALDWGYIYYSDKEANEEQAKILNFDLSDENISENITKNIVYTPWNGYISVDNYLKRILKSHLLENENVMFDFEISPNLISLSFQIKNAYYDFLNNDEEDDCSQFMDRLDCTVLCRKGVDDIYGCSEYDYNGISFHEQTFNLDEQNKEELNRLFRVNIRRNISDVLAIRLNYY